MTTFITKKEVRPEISKEVGKFEEGPYRILKGSTIEAEVIESNDDGWFVRAPDSEYYYFSKENFKITIL